MYMMVGRLLFLNVGGHTEKKKGGTEREVKGKNNALG